MYVARIENLKVNCLFMCSTENMSISFNTSQCVVEVLNHYEDITCCSSLNEINLGNEISFRNSRNIEDAASGLLIVVK